jgi:hypothetical protein
VGPIRFIAALQDLLVERCSDTLKALAELDAVELQRHRQNTLMWQAGIFLIFLFRPSVASCACADLFPAKS